MTRHTFRQNPNGRYDVGYPAATGWKTIGQVDTLDEAMAWTSHLNGGARPPGPIKPP
jgi:hypothetical protein